MHPLIEKFIAGQLPEPMAMTLMGGGLPLPLLDLLQGLSHAIFKETPFAEKAKETLDGMPDSLLSNAIIGPVEPPDPLGLILIYNCDEYLMAEYSERSGETKYQRLVPAPQKDSIERWLGNHFPPRKTLATSGD